MLARKEQISVAEGFCIATLIALLTPVLFLSGVTLAISYLFGPRAFLYTSAAIYDAVDDLWYTSLHVILR